MRSSKTGHLSGNTQSSEEQEMKDQWPSTSFQWQENYCQGAIILVPRLLQKYQ